MAIVDANNMMSGPKGLTAASGIDAVSHALEAYASVMATDFTDGLALKALKVIFEYLPACYDNGMNEPVAREKVAHAATMAGMAFANAFLGVCHSMAHKLGAFHHIAHGVANALMLEQVIRFNSVEAPTKMGTFAQYDHPHTLERYAEIAQFLGFGGKDDKESVENLIKGINDLKARVGIKATIADYGVSEESFLATLDEMTEQAFDDQCTGANPRYPLISEIKQRNCIKKGECKMKFDTVLAERKHKVIYRDGDLCAKVFDESFPKSDILNEALNQARVEETGLNIPKIEEVTKIDGKWAIISDYIEGKTLQELMDENPDKLDEYLNLFVDIQKDILSKKCPLLKRLKDKMQDKISQTDLDATTRYELHTRLASMKKHSKVCHGDFNPSNVIITPEGVPTPHRATVRLTRREPICCSVSRATRSLRKST